MKVKKKRKQREPIHVLNYGEPGSGKSRLAATFPTPMQVFMFDPIGKDRPFLNRGIPQPVVKEPKRNPYRVVHDQEGKEIIRIDYFVNTNIKRPDAFEYFQMRMHEVERDVLKGKIQTVVFDNASSAEMAARKLHQYMLNPGTKNSIQWYGGATELLEDAILVTLAGFPCNVVVIAHVNENFIDADGTAVRNPALPGKRMPKRGPAWYAEVYRSHVFRDEKGDRVFALQTITNEDYIASTQIGAPDPCYPTYKALWQTFDQKGSAQEKAED